MKISVILPIYNGEKYLQKCIDSLLVQDYPDYEIILVDDGSLDRSGEICDKYSEKEPRIKTLHQKNSGASAARNAGLCIASGDYVTFVDSDDWVDSNYLSVLQSYMQEASMVVSSFIRETDKRKETTSTSLQCKSVQISYLDPVDAEESAIRPDGIGGYIWSKLFDKKVINEFNIKFCEEIAFCEDQLFLIEYLSHLKKQIVWIKIPIYHYRINMQSTLHLRYQKIDQFNPKLLSEVRAIELEMKYIDEKLLNVFNARLVSAKRMALYIMELNKWQKLSFYREYLSDIRRNLFYYLRFDIGQTWKSKLNMILCAIHPKLSFSFVNIHHYIYRKKISHM